MEDEMIVRLYWDRNEQAIKESRAKYGSYCTSIASNILQNRQDTEECVNDTWLHAWNAIPPSRPKVLSTFLGKITRNLALDIYRKLHREKRGGGQFDVVLDELSEVISGKEDPQGSWEETELKEEINAFLRSVPKERRYMFVLRYWYGESVKEIAQRFSMTENNVSVILNRLRNRLKGHLNERGYDI